MSYACEVMHTGRTSIFFLYIVFYYVVSPHNHCVVIIIIIISFHFASAKQQRAGRVVRNIFYAQLVPPHDVSTRAVAFVRGRAVIINSYARALSHSRRDGIANKLTSVFM